MSYLLYSITYINMSHYFLIAFGSLRDLSFSHMPFKEIPISIQRPEIVHKGTISTYGARSLLIKILLFMALTLYWISQLKDFSIKIAILLFFFFSFLPRPPGSPRTTSASWIRGSFFLTFLQFILNLFWMLLLYISLIKLNFK